MHVNHDYVALDWVKDEIEVTLKQAQQALEAFSDNPQDTTRMRFCLTYLHQVHGTLQMVEFFGASLLAEEMEMLAQAILNQETVNSEAAQGVLLQATFQLPTYLDRVKQDRKDMPIIILPLLNQLRSARGENLLSETSIFNPDMESGNEAFFNRPRIIEKQTTSPSLKQIRQLLQVSYASILRDKDIDTQLAKIAKVTKLVEQQAQGFPAAQLWWIACALIEGLLNKSISLNDASKNLLSTLDKHLKKAVQSDGESFHDELDQYELKKFLIIIAQSGACTPLLNEVKTAYSLNDILLADHSYNEGQHAHTEIDRAALQSATTALTEEINDIKERLDVFIRSKERNVDVLDKLAKIVKHSSDTMALLGMGAQRNILIKQAETLNWCSANSEQEGVDNKLLDIAGALIYVESTLSAHHQGGASSLGDDPSLTLSPQHVNQAQLALIRECQAGLETAKDHVVDFIVSQWDTAHLDGVSDIFEEISGGLKIINQGRASTLVNFCSHFVSEHLLRQNKNNTPNWQVMDTLADAISSIECYLERLVNDSHTDDYILDIAESSLASMGYVREADVLETEETLPAEATTDAMDDTLDDAINADQVGLDHNIGLEDQEPSDSFGAADELIAFDENTAVIDLDLTADALDFSETEINDNQINSFAPESSDETQSLNQDTASDTTEPKQEMPPVLAEQPPEEDDMIDDEIIEIFVEECEEVLEAINTHLPVWKNNWEDQASLTELRRAFHTLKGSGRLVGAKEAGELAWSVENMLNRVIDKTISISSVMIDLIEQIAPLFPDYVTAFEKQTPAPTSGDALMERANRISDGLDESLALTPEDTPQEEHPESILEPIDSIADTSIPEELSNEETEDALIASDPEQDTHDAELATTETSETSEEDAKNKEFEAAILKIFIGEAESHLATIQHYLDAHPIDSAPAKVSTEVLRALHTLKGSAQMANTPGIAAIVSPVEQLVKQVTNGDYLLQADLLSLLADSTAVIGEKVLHLHTDSSDQFVPDEDVLMATIAHLEAQNQQQAETSNRFTGKNFINIFLAEEMDIILEAGDLLNRWEQAPSSFDSVYQLEKDIIAIAEHADRANLPEIERLCTLLSKCYDAARNKYLATDPVFFRTAHKAHETLMELMDRLAAHQPIDESHDVEHQLESLLNTSVTEQEAVDLDPSGSTEPLDETVDLTGFGDAEEASSEVTDFETTYSPNETDQVATSNPATSEMDDELVDIFLEEAEELCLELSEGLQVWADAPTDLHHIDLILRHLHTLKGSARMAEIAPIGDLAHEIESLYEGCRHGTLTFSAELLSLLNQANDSLADMITSLQDQTPCQPAPALIEELSAFQTVPAPVDQQDNEATQAHALIEGELLEHDFTEEPVPEFSPKEESVTAVEPETETSDSLDFELDPELIEIFLEEAEEILDSVSGNLERWASDTSNTDEIEQLQRSLHTLKGSARMAGIKPIGNLSHELETLYELSTNGVIPYSKEMGELLNQCHDTLGDMVDAVKSKTELNEADILIKQVLDFCHQAGQTNDVLSESSSEAEAIAHGSADEDNVVPISSSSTVPQTVETTVKTVNEELFIDTSDVEVISLFVEEANELLEGIEASIEQWETEPGSSKQDEELKRLLHTLKGSSRLAGLSQLGDLSHNFETYIVDLEQYPESNKETLFKHIKGHYDGLVTWVAKLAEQLKGQAQQDRTKELAEQGAKVTREAQSAKEKPLSKKQEQQESAKAATQEMIRVSSELLEDLVNLAGETSINRAQMEKEVTDFSHTLNEIGDTIERLQEQMRRLNMETEAQILFSHESQVQEEDAYDDFDPLEMDRYSLIHQLSRSLSESTHDLTDLKDTLSNKARDTETLLLQQSRINTELQEGLMRTRLVPFSRLAPRLRRMVRQVSQEVGKLVELEIVNAEGEMDRAVLDRLVSPLEHMLRNSIDHGIEMPEAREKQGKNKKGKITLHLSREGAEVVIRLSDDGAGIDATKVRQKAVERKLLDNHAELTETEILQFIFKPGFSTAEKVTQLSGRGVGMDVVNNEIKQLSGTTRIHSSPGVGTQFTIRLPFTVSVNRALMVKVGEDTYAIPLSHIEGIVRVSPFELENFYQTGNEDKFQYAERDYHLQYLGAYVKNIPSPILQGQSQPLPVILVRGTDKPMAFQVDSLIGSREVVVKSLGPQLSSVTGLSGATILGDGNVVVILDLISMIRSDWAERLYGDATKEAAITEKAGNEIPTVMVVDDSVTVRKITSRLLERAGYEVILAKDGMDAISILQDHTPDVMLLDIEMPRMDGFEVASIIKHEDRLKDISIIMITSRTGQKHRDRAMSIGVDEYLGKPFQEAELLKHIEKFITVDVTA